MIYKYDVGAVVQVQLPSTFDPASHLIEGTLRKAQGDVVPITPALSGSTGAYTASYTSVRGQLDAVGTYAFSITVKSRTTADSKDLDPVFFRVWPRGRRGSS